MANWGRNTHARLMCGAAMLALLGSAGAAVAEEAAKFNIAPQSLANALNEFAVQSPWPILYTTSMTGGKMTAGVKEATDPEVALNTLLAGTGLSYRREGDTFLIVQGGSADPQSGSAAGDGAEGTVEALIVTAQKREEDIQDVPIAISAFTQDDLTRSQIAGGPDLITQVPNLTFTKTNFASYSIQIRGIGTQAISATTDPAVAVAFNNTPFVRNRFFEQEFYDLARVEVLRGPQGTLYGRNATAGVVNIISAKPKFIFEAKASADVSNYNSARIEGMVNIPLVEDAVALRLAGAWTKRDGFVRNEITGAPIDGRDLWSTRVSLRFAPQNAPFDVNLIWEHFEEDDDRLRSGKQLCKKHKPEFLTAPDGTMVPINLSDGGLGGEAQYNQGCERVSLYSPDAFQTPNGEGIPYYRGLQGIGLAMRDVIPGNCCTDVMDPYLSTTQSRDLRVIESTVDPEYRASTDIFELQANFDVTDDLTLTSETSYSRDELFSLQDLNRFNTTPGVFAQHVSERVSKYPTYNILTPGPNGGGIFCDPQIGCSDRLVAMDLSTAESTQFSQEFRLGSDFEGPFNFSLGANFLRTDTIDKYYVFINTVTLTSFSNPLGGNSQTNPIPEPPPYVPNVSDNRECRQGVGPWYRPDPTQIQGIVHCIYTDPNPIGSLNDKGHNYFLSNNPYKLISYAVFGEAYYQLADNLKITGGLRWTVDRKEAPRIPSMLLAANTLGYTVEAVVEQEWREPTGRLTIDWKPDIAFTDETMIYGSYAHGYKAGGANPPPTAVITYGGVGAAGRLDNYATFPRTFEPEFIDAFEIGAKNTLFDGTVTLNTAAFYYDYKNYQVSEIVDRAALNRNFDATVWGVEVEADWRPIENLKLGFKGGYEKTEVADGEQAIDLMDRTAGDPDWVVLKPFPASPSNCVLPTWLATWGGDIFNGWDDWGACVQVHNGFDPVTLAPYVPNPVPPALKHSGDASSPGFWNGYPGYDPRSANNSQGLFKQLGGNELPNAPNWTATVSADYTLPLAGDWLMALHSDIHWQSESWWRVFNDHEYNKLDEFYLINMAAIFTNEAAGWNVMAYVKNVLDEDALTGAFLFSDDTGLTTNVFLTEPRLYGLRVTKAWSGGPLLGSFGGRRDGPYPFTVELGGQVQRHDAPYETIAPAFVSEFSEGIDPTISQHRDLDWGDGREVKLSYRPNDAWKLSLGARIGKANSFDESFEYEDSGYLMCFQLSQPSYQITCEEPENFRGVDNHSETTVRNKEEYDIVDFEVGREFAIGGLDSSEIGLGLRYAQFESGTTSLIMGTPDWYIPPRSLYKYAPFAWTKYDAHHTDYEAQLDAQRKFEGVGPVVSWDASRALLGNDGLGRINIDTAISGGVLFGEQDTQVLGEVVAEYVVHPFDNSQFWTADITPGGIRTVTPIDIRRSSSVTVPLLDVSLGLSYEIDRVKLSAGYRWERYFNAIDGGYDEQEDADRTIDGPYFKLSVGFGG